MEQSSSGALFDPTRRYRYRLWRAWVEGPRVLFVMLNPSTADEMRDDPTIRRCVGFARRWGYGQLDVCNLFALRSRDPLELWRAHVVGDDPVGDANDQELYESACQASCVIAAWGGHGAILDRGRVVTDQLRAAVRTRTLYCLGRTKGGAPRHPLFVPSDRPLEVF